MIRQSGIAAVCLTAVLLFFPARGLQFFYPEDSFLAVIASQQPQHRRSVPASIATYEKLIRQSADDIGWDWRLVAAVVYHESRFNNEAQSGKGATGLMQIHSTRYSPDTLLIPTVNLSIGTAYLRRLENMFPAASPRDSLKFALAAFNLGDGKVKKLIAEADSAGLDPGRWDQVAHMLPEGHHTVAYVDKVLKTFDDYSRELPH